MALPHTSPLSFLDMPSEIHGSFTTWNISLYQFTLANQLPGNTVTRDTDSFKGNTHFKLMLYEAGRVTAPSYLELQETCSLLIEREAQLGYTESGLNVFGQSICFTGNGSRQSIAVEYLKNMGAGRVIQTNKKGMVNLADISCWSIIAPTGDPPPLPD